MTGGSNWQELQALDDKHHGEIPKTVIDKLEFWDRMKLMVRMSDNMATGSVASEIGPAYLLGTLMNDGFWTPQTHGLWLSNTYGYDGKFMGFEGKGDDITAGATAFAVADFFTLLYHKKN